MIDPDTPQNPFTRSALIVMIIGIVILLLSGLCTGLFLSFGQDDYVPGPLGVIAIGSFGLVPGAMLFFAGRRVWRKGPTIWAGVLMAIISLPLLFYSLAMLVTEFRGLSGFSVFSGTLGLAGILLLVFGIKVIRAALSAPPTADKFL